jgi:hypothetical protein
VGTLRHLDVRLLDLGAQPVEVSRGEHPVRRRHVQVTGTRVLREIADRPERPDAAGERQALSGQGAQCGGLARSVATHQTDAVGGTDP